MITKASQRILILFVAAFSQWKLQDHNSTNPVIIILIVSYLNEQKWVWASALGRMYVVPFYFFMEKRKLGQHISLHSCPLSWFSFYSCFKYKYLQIFGLEEKRAWTNSVVFKYICWDFIPQILLQCPSQPKSLTLCS